ncbi:MAG: FHA domain-containing protein [Hyphomicrobiaceae bacterium]
MKDITPVPTRLADQVPPATPVAPATGMTKTAREAASEARGGTPNVPPVEDLEPEPDVAPTTAVARGGLGAASHPTPAHAQPQKTQVVRGRNNVVRGDFAQDPVVAWLVVVGGPGLGLFRPVFEGNNTLGRSPTNRIPIDFGDDAISSEEQAYIRYDSTDRSFLFVPNMAKTNVVSVNEKRPAQPVELHAMDLITMGKTQLVFVPFCGPDFDWSELSRHNR